jgi:hypothetical protein
LYDVTNSLWRKYLRKPNNAEKCCDNETLKTACFKTFYARRGFMIGHRFNGHNLRRKQREELQVAQAGALAIAKKSNPDIAQELGVSVRTVERYIKKFLETRSRFPLNLTAEGVNELRALEAQALEKFNNRLESESEAVMNDPGIPHNVKLAVLSKATFARSRTNERLALMFGLDQPTQIVEESMRLQINATQGGDGKVQLSFDRSQIDAMAAGPCPELVMESEPFVEPVAALRPGTTGAAAAVLEHGLAKVA